MRLRVAQAKNLIVGQIRCRRPTRRSHVVRGACLPAVTSRQRHRSIHMASDIQLNDNAVVVEGNVGIGTSNPVRKLHVAGSEVHSGGPVSGFSIGDRTMGNERRWVLYSEESHLRVWAQKDGTDKLILHANGDMFVTRDLHGPEQ